jgi:hypothetical protein
VDFIAPPHTPTSIKQYISRVEGNPALVTADLFANTSSDSPMKEELISILSDRCPGLNKSDPMALVQRDKSEGQASGSQPKLCVVNMLHLGDFSLMLNLFAHTHRFVKRIQEDRSSIPPVA